MADSEMFWLFFNLNIQQPPYPDYAFPRKIYHPLEACIVAYLSNELQNTSDVIGIYCICIRKINVFWSKTTERLLLGKLSVLRTGAAHWLL